ncbi:MAG: hypothetical protein AAGA85_19475 [Bacteroidota bacterium]
MRKLFLGVVAVLFIAASATTAMATELHVTTIIDQQEEKTEIEMEEVPSAVKEGWNNETTYANSEVLLIYEVKTPTETYIEFVVQKGQEKMAVHFDLQGNLLREKVVNT